MASVLLPKLLFPKPLPQYEADRENIIWIPDLRRPKAREYRIPCLYLPSNAFSRYCVLFFHGNAEDLGTSYDFCCNLRLCFQVHVVAPELPSYGLATQNVTPSEETLIDYANSALDFILRDVGWPIDSVIVMGRSIGCFSALELASQYPLLGGLCLVSPFANLQTVVEERVGEWMAALVCDELAFNNVERIRRVFADTLIIHGKVDKVVQFKNSEMLYECCNAKRRTLIQPKSMHHNTSLFSDPKIFIEPMLQFFCLPDYIFDPIELSDFSEYRLIKHVARNTSLSTPRVSSPRWGRKSDRQSGLDRELLSARRHFESPGANTKFKISNKPTAEDLITPRPAPAWSPSSGLQVRSSVNKRGGHNIGSDSAFDTRIGTLNVNNSQQGLLKWSNIVDEPAIPIHPIDPELEHLPNGGRACKALKSPRQKKMETLLKKAAKRKAEKEARRRELADDLISLGLEIGSSSSGDFLSRESKELGIEVSGEEDADASLEEHCPDEIFPMGETGGTPSNKRKKRNNVRETKEPKLASKNFSLGSSQEHALSSSSESLANEDADSRVYRGGQEYIWQSEDPVYKRDKDLMNMMNNNNRELLDNLNLMSNIAGNGAGNAAKYDTIPMSPHNGGDDVADEEFDERLVTKSHAGGSPLARRGSPTSSSPTGTSLKQVPQGQMQGQGHKTSSGVVVPPISPLGRAGPFVQAKKPGSSIHQKPDGTMDVDEAICPADGSLGDEIEDFITLPNAAGGRKAKSLEDKVKRGGVTQGVATRINPVVNRHGSDEDSRPSMHDTSQGFEDHLNTNEDSIDTKSHGFELDRSNVRGFSVGDGNSTRISGYTFNTNTQKDWHTIGNVSTRRINKPGGTKVIREVGGDVLETPQPDDKLAKPSVRDAQTAMGETDPDVYINNPYTIQALQAAGKYTLS